jgi:beta-glucanase (GH16 family)
MPLFQRSRQLAALLLFGLLASACAQPVSTTPAGPTAIPRDGRLLWAEEFDYEGLPDPEKWGYEVGNRRNREWQYYTWGRKENAWVADGVLTITASDETFENNKYTSASITTADKYYMQYGTIEVRAKLPKGRGTWPAIWMLGKNYNEGVAWPKCGELDLMENVGFDPNRIHATVHTAKRNHVSKTESTNSIELADPWTFHDYKMTWTPDLITFFIDGVEVHAYPNDGGGVDTWPFDQPMYLILNLAIGGTWGGQQGVDDAIFPASYQIDYVRIYALSE